MLNTKEPLYAQHFMEGVSSVTPGTIQHSRQSINNDLNVYGLAIVADSVPAVDFTRTGVYVTWRIEQGPIRG